MPLLRTARYLLAKKRIPILQSVWVVLILALHGSSIEAQTVAGQVESQVTECYASLGKHPPLAPLADKVDLTSGLRKTSLEMQARNTKPNKAMTA